MMQALARYLKTKEFVALKLEHRLGSSQCSAILVSWIHGPTPP